MSQLSPILRGGEGGRVAFWCPGCKEKLMGWGVVSKTGFCTSHIVDPFVLWLPEFLGHEVAHCAFGRFHGAPVP